MYIYGQFRRKRLEYKHLIRDAKKKSWRSLTTEATKENPYSLPYKLAADKVPKKEVLTSLRKGNNYTKTGLETMALLIETLIPPDDLREEDENHQEVRRNSTTPASCNIEPPISPAELEPALKNTKLRKAAGPDRMPPEIFKNLDRGNREDLLMLLNLLLEKETFPEVWKRAKLKVIRKSGNRDLVQSWILTTQKLTACCW